MIVYVADLSELETDPTLILKYEGFLSDSERKRYHGMTNTHRRLQFLLGRALIYENCHQSPVLLSTGKPTIQNGFISLAHSGPYVLLALSDSSVGIDIEDSSKNKNFDALADRLGFSLTSNKRLSFYQNFTCYEADYKMASKSNKRHHKFYSIKTFIICVSFLNNKENIKFIKSIPFIKHDTLRLKEIPDENI